MVLYNLLSVAVAMFMIFVQIQLIYCIVLVLWLINIKYCLNQLIHPKRNTIRVQFHHLWVMKRTFCVPEVLVLIMDKVEHAEFFQICSIGYDPVSQVLEERCILSEEQNSCSLVGFVVSKLHACYLLQGAD